MRLHLRLAALALLLAAQPAPAGADAISGVTGSGLTGRWLTQDRDGVVEIAACGAALCGRIVGMDHLANSDGSQPRDVRGRQQCGLEILRVTPGDGGRWRGTITNPEDGSVWNSALWLDGRGRLNLRGYVLLPVLGETQVWTAYTGTVDAECRMRQG